MKNILIVILIAIVGYFGWFYYTSNMAEETTPSVVITEKETESLAVDELAIDQQEQLPPTGIVSGKLCFPSEGIPELMVYLDPVEDTEPLVMETIQDTMGYEFMDVPVGEYVAYAYTKDENPLSGGYTPAVACGLTVECTDHSLAVIEVNAGADIKNIDICDWYGAEVPPKP